MAKSKLPKFRTSRTQKFAPGELKLFRAAVSQLKKQGIIPPSVDSRSARPYFVRGGKRLADVVNSNRRKIDKSVPPFTPVVKPSSPLDIPARDASPLKIRDFPTKGKSLATVMKEMERDPDKFDKLKRKGEKWAFRINGTDSRNIFSSVQLMVDDAFRYGTGKGPYGNFDIFHKRSRSDNLYDKIELIRWTGGVEKWKVQRKTPTKGTKMKAIKQAERRAARRSGKK